MPTRCGPQYGSGRPLGHAQGPALPSCLPCAPAALWVMAGAGACMLHPCKRLEAPCHRSWPIHGSSAQLTVLMASPFLAQSLHSGPVVFLSPLGNTVSPPSSGVVLQSGQEQIWEARFWITQRLNALLRCNTAGRELHDCRMQGPVAATAAYDQRAWLKRG